MPGVTPVGNPYASAPGQQPAPVERRSPVRGEHLAEWMNQHRNLTPEQQQQALGREPGFSSLPPQTQQRYRDHLAELNAMNPARRQRELAHIEAMERLSLPQRAEVRSAMGQLGSLPIDQRMVVAREFRALRELPANQQIPAMNSGRFGPPLNGAQRATLYRLLQVEPLLYPAARPGAVPQQMMPMQPVQPPPQ